MSGQRQVTQMFKAPEEYFYLHLLSRWSTQLRLIYTRGRCGARQKKIRRLREWLTYNISFIRISAKEQLFGN